MPAVIRDHNTETIEIDDKHRDTVESATDSSGLRIEHLIPPGATPADVVEIQVYIVDLEKVDPAPVYEAVRDFFPPGHNPASMVIGVSALAHPGLLLEINVRAVVEE